MACFSLSAKPGVRLLMDDSCPKVGELDIKNRQESTWCLGQPMLDYRQLLFSTSNISSKHNSNRKKKIKLDDFSTVFPKL